MGRFNKSTLTAAVVLLIASFAFGYDSQIVDVKGGGARTGEIEQECDAILNYLEERYGVVEWKDFPVTFGATSPGIAGYCSSYGDRVSDVRIGVGYDSAVGSTLDHELTHAYVVYRIGSGSNLFWNEGTAQNSEYKSRERYRETIYNRLQNDDLVSLRRLIERNSYDGNFSLYNQSFSVVDFLIAKGGSKWFIMFFDDAQKHGTDAALKSFYGFDNIEALERAWLDYVKSGQNRAKARTVIEDCQK